MQCNCILFYCIVLVWYGMVFVAYCIELYCTVLYFIVLYCIVCVYIYIYIMYNVYYCECNTIHGCSMHPSSPAGLSPLPLQRWEGVDH